MKKNQSVEQFGSEIGINILSASQERVKKPLTKLPGQEVQIKIRLLLQEQSDLVCTACCSEKHFINKRTDNQYSSSELRPQIRVFEKKFLFLTKSYVMDTQ